MQLTHGTGGLTMNSAGSVPRMFVKRRVSSPCFECAERQSGCHSKCEKYGSFKAGTEADYKARKAVYYGERMFQEYNIEGAMIAKKKREVRGKYDR
jgi:hypothetical protein